MLVYQYKFTSKETEYYVYAPCEEDSIKQYLCENGLKELPIDCVITRRNA